MRSGVPVRRHHLSAQLSRAAASASAPQTANGVGAVVPAEIRARIESRNTVSVLCLSFHAEYRCRHTGACCTSGWAIPVEPSLRARLDAALALATLTVSEAGDTRDRHAARSPFVEDASLPDGSSILRVAANGACTCYDATGCRCGLHAQLGHDALPVACQHFPRVCLVDRDATYVTLSHYCPTAARMLFAEASLEPCPTRSRPPSPAPARLEPCPSDSDIVEASKAFAPMALEGLDARDALPPLIHPRMLGDRESYHSWERLVVQALNEAGGAEEALEAIIDATERLRGWEPKDGPLADAVSRVFLRRGGAGTEVRAGVDTGGSARPSRLNAAALSLDDLVRRSVPDGLHAPDATGSLADVYTDLVAPKWPAFERPVRRYIAAKAFANWTAYQGRGLRTVVSSLVAALCVLRVEAARQCASAGRRLDEPLLVEAFRAADLLLVHLASREELARRLSAVEEGVPGDLRSALSLSPSLKP